MFITAEYGFTDDKAEFIILAVFIPRTSELRVVVKDFSRFFRSMVNESISSILRC